MKLFGAMEIKENELYIGGVSSTNLVSEFGSPLYVMDEELLINTCKSYYKNFKCKENNNRVAYAGKAFLTMAMCKLINEQGLYLDVVSGGELYTAYKSGFPLEKVYFHGNNKTYDEIELGVKLGVGRFIVDNIEEMTILNEIATKYNKKQDIYLRLTPGIEAHTHDYIKTGQIDSKFGFAPVGNTIMNAVKYALDYENLNLKGLHCHIGSQIFDIAPFEDAAEIMLGFINDIKKETGHIISELDLGGGFGIHYTNEDKPRETREYCEAILNRVDKVCEKLALERPILTIEPGRSIVGNAGTTLYTIGAIKEIEGVRTYISVDGGMTDNIRPALYGAKYDMTIANKVNDKKDNMVTVAGKCCESGDIFVKDINLQETKRGDVLAVFTTGAYGFSMASNYNKNPRAAVVFVKDGIARLVSKRQSYEDLLSLEV
ncbi:diaminopimelate decarboxylase [Clostridium celatum]|uniref:diaminopimelate decarboxylase n=1 Tax=Clostridium celatum TaxID=36834 RepID=UPI0029017D84|nr:diaminopimelate decarboxylase [Clostridium celatum]MDU2265689.1 diaminopimelate decarboxylase [Clostridium celatum]MDU3722885.1 diaminopimelate decarboxylase [Clostridium celatum]MDU6295652.1 diaminopimelate decarboxylase [Clostridium celatum]MDY3359463.1 diaminopimelate decarboxylase [Clostridium celatum]